MGYSYNGGGNEFKERLLFSFDQMNTFVPWKRNSSGADSHPAAFNASLRDML